MNAQRFDAGVLGLAAGMISGRRRRLVGCDARGPAALVRFDPADSFRRIHGQHAAVLGEMARLARGFIRSSGLASFALGVTERVHSIVLGAQRVCAHVESALASVAQRSIARGRDEALAPISLARDEV